MLIEGVVCPIGKLNKRGWGVSRGDVDSLVQTLMTSPVRAPTSRIDEHWDDYVQNPRAEIGKHLKVWNDENYVYALAEIKDSIAQQKITDGVWSKDWSIAGWGNLGDDGLTDGTGFNSIGLMLVNEGAWDEATYNVVSASKDGKGALFGAAENFKVNPEPNDDAPQTKSGENMEEKIKELEALVASKEQEIVGLKEDVQKLQASVKATEDKTKDMIPQEIAEKLAAAKAKEAVDVYHETTRKQTAIGSYQKLMAGAGLEITEDEQKFIESMSSEQVERMVEKMGALSASKDAVYEKKQSESKPTAGLTVGRYVNGEWKDGV